METITNSNIERKTVTEECISVTVTAPINEKDAKLITTYAAMTKIDQGMLIHNLISRGLKEIRAKLEDLPYTDSNEIIKKYTNAQMS